MANNASTSGWSYILQVTVGFALLFGIGFGVFKGLQVVYRGIFPSPQAASVSLSAYFQQGTDSVETLTVVGNVQESGTPVDSGTVKLTLRKVSGDFRQSVALDLRQGKFQASNVLAFRKIKPGDVVQIAVEVWSPALTYQPVTERLYLNAREPARCACAVAEE